MARKPRNPGAGRLAEYESKRDFSRTAEPAGKASGSASGRLYVIQKHRASHLHYDLRLEMDGVLKSWATPRGPSLDPKDKQLAVHTEDHPIEYGDFEGVIPEGEYGGGAVMIWDRGEWEPIGDPREGYKKGDLKFRLHGEKLRGEWVLARMTPKRPSDERNWLLIKKRDAESRLLSEYNVLAQEGLSVATGRNLKQIASDADLVWKEGRAQSTDGSKKTTAGVLPTDRATAEGGPDPSGLTRAKRGDPPESISPQLCTSSSTAPEGDDWLHEIKLDGYRLIARLEGGAVTLLTRNGHDWTDRFPGIARALQRLPTQGTVLDGEAVVLDSDGVSDFAALQNALRGKTPGGIAYMVFDVPYAAGHDLRKTPLVERKSYLRDLLTTAPLAPTVQYCDHIVGKGPLVFEKAKEAGLEGVVSKRADARYESRRSTTWLKIKASQRQEFVIGGFTRGEGSRADLGALIVGYYGDQGLVYCGSVGSGFDEPTLEELRAELSARTRKSSPFVNEIPPPEAKKATWVAPELVAEVEFATWTSDGRLRHPVFRGLREDVPTERVSREPAPRPTARGTPKRKRPTVVRKKSTPSGAGGTTDAIVSGARITHPDRVVYPDDGVTKVDVARYYEQVAPWILPHLVDRPLSIVRCPLGLAGESFYQRHRNDTFPDPVKAVSVGDELDGPAIVIRDVDGLLALAQFGVMEIHPWGSRVDAIEKPDRLIFDLDPGPGLKWEHVAASALVVNKLLTDLGLRAFAKTSGGKGIHVVVPITRRSTWEEAKGFTHGVAKRLASMAPRNFVAIMTKSLRTQRVFVDYLRNRLGATAVGAYSTRARDGALVSMPVTWGELEAGARPEDFTVRSAPARLTTLETDPWDGFFELRQSITADMKRAIT